MITSFFFLEVYVQHYVYYECELAQSDNCYARLGRAISSSSLVPRLYLHTTVYVSTTSM